MIKRPELIPTALTGDLRRGGWTLAGQIAGDTDAVSRGLNVRLMGRGLTSYTDSASREVFNGHILHDPDFSFSRHESNATFVAATVDSFLAGESIQDISFATVGSPANSHEATSWNFGDTVEHILQHHCNYIYDDTGAAGSPDGVVTDTDIDTTNSTTFEVFISRKSNNMWRTLQQIGGGEEGGGEFYRIYVNRHNKIVYQPAPPFLSPQPAAKGTLTKEHLRGMIRVQLHNSKPGEAIGQATILAVKNATTIYSASYPSAPGDGQIFRKESGVWAQSQARTDTLAERLYKWLTRSYTLTVEVDPSLVLFGDDGLGLDLGDRLLLTYDGPTEDTATGAGVHLNLSAQSLFVYGVQIRYDAAGRAATATLTLEHDNA